jgi:hypothetical protein
MHELINNNINISLHIIPLKIIINVAQIFLRRGGKEKRPAEGSFFPDFFVSFWGNAKKKKKKEQTVLQ